MNQEWFCPDVGSLTAESVVDVVLSKPFGPDIDDVALERYLLMRKNLNISYEDERWVQSCGCKNGLYRNVHKKRKPVYKDALLNVGAGHFKAQFWQSMTRWYNVGFDMPVWFASSQRPKRRIMIVAQDPLREGHDNGRVLLSTPWGLHSKSYRSSQKNQIERVIDFLVGDCDCCVYLTDYTKFYFSSARGGRCANAYGLQERRQHQESLMMPGHTLETVIRAEVDLLQPDLFVTFGSWVNGGVWPLSFDPIKLQPRDVMIFGKKLGVGVTLYHPNVRQSNSVMKRIRELEADSLMGYYETILSRVLGDK